MRLSWPEIRAKAARFAEDWKDGHYERGETQSFYNDFFEVFGASRRRVASYEEPVKGLGNRRGFIDLFWKGVLLVEQKSAGRNLKKAKEQALDYFPELKDHELPRYLLVSDFQQFELYDLDEGTEIRFPLRDLPRHAERFAFIVGVEKRIFRDQDPVNIEASELLGSLHDALKASGYKGHSLEQFLVRLLFCLFADSTGVFERGSFRSLMEDRTLPDGSDLGPWLTQLFDVLDTPGAERSAALDDNLTQFPYVNGDLFRERLRIPAFDLGMRGLLLEACRFNWEAVSPAIFGSLFQSVMETRERRAQGAHYTTERNILKVIQPLFLDDLREELEQLKQRRDTGRRKAVEAFHEKLGSLHIFDPACGCGNFLVIAYRELRLLEIEALKLLRGLRRAEELKIAAVFSRVDVDQFYGIEIGEFPARIAEVALWMMDHIMNNRLSAEFGSFYTRIPLHKSPHIHPVDALETDWSGVLPPERCSYVLGNPPFGGAKYQTDKQREQVRRIARLGGSGGTLDYVTAWYIKAGEYLANSRARIGFVGTNSITQGEQVAQLWPVLFGRCGLEISFAHRTFAWGSDARGKAHVHVVIIGLCRRDDEPPLKRLFTYDDIKGDPTESRHASLTPYLFDGSGVADRHLVVKESSQQLCRQPKIVIGSKPIDGGWLIFNDEERNAFIAQEPNAAKFMRPFLGGKEYIQGIPRWILALQNATPTELRSMPKVVERLRAVREYRQGERAARKKEDGEIKPPGISARALADTPTEFHVTVIPTKPFLTIPENSSQEREYLPIGWLEPPVIPSNKLRIAENADPYQFAILTSRMHMAWLRYVGGRIKSDFQYSIGIVYNPFPWPDVDDKQRARIRDLAQAVLTARARFPGASMADLYDSDVMKPELLRAHRALDAAVDKLYRAEPFPGDRQRVEHLFTRYEKLVTPLTAAPKKRRGRQR
ncbi:MAG TPA: DNA methyltransferase [Candidatus Acidoferrales bacterium]|nr:DNA methyltransferase [Candidatus Acidoferrales bacterium]